MIAPSLNAMATNVAGFTKRLTYETNCRVYTAQDHSLSHETKMTETRGETHKAFDRIVKHVDTRPSTSSRWRAWPRIGRAAGLLRLSDRVLGAYLHYHPIESTFATFCLQTKRNWNCSFRATTLTTAHLAVNSLIESVDNAAISVFLPLLGATSTV